MSCRTRMDVLKSTIWLLSIRTDRNPYTGWWLTRSIILGPALPSSLPSPPSAPSYFAIIVERFFLWYYLNPAL